MHYRVVMSARIIVGVVVVGMLGGCSTDESVAAYALAASDATVDGDATMDATADGDAATADAADGADGDGAMMMCSQYFGCSGCANVIGDGYTIYTPAHGRRDCPAGATSGTCNVSNPPGGGASGCFRSLGPSPMCAIDTNGTCEGATSFAICRNMTAAGTVQPLSITVPCGKQLIIETASYGNMCCSNADCGDGKTCRIPAGGGVNGGGGGTCM